MIKETMPLAKRIAEARSYSEVDKYAEHELLGALADLAEEYAAAFEQAPHGPSCPISIAKLAIIDRLPACRCWKSKLPAGALDARDSRVRRDGFVAGVNAASEAAGAYFGSRVVNQYGPNIVEGTWEGMEAAFAKVLNRVKREASA